MKLIVNYLSLNYFLDKAKPSIVIDTNIQSILNVDEVESRFSVKFELDVAWQDPRLEFTNMKRDRDSNILVFKHKEMIWIPEFIFINTDDVTEATFKDEQSFGFVKICECNNT